MQVEALLLGLQSSLHLHGSSEEENLRTSHNDDFSVVKVKAYEVRSTCIGVLFKENFSVQQAVRAGTWVSQTTFTSYLRDVTHRLMGTFFIVPVMGTQKVHFSVVCPACFL